MNPNDPRLPLAVMSRISLAKSGCWTWTGSAHSNGYGQVSYGTGPSRLAHRVVYGLLVGAIPDGLTLDHLCRNRRCVNPDHLEPVTNKVNSLRGNGLGALNLTKTHCPLGHPFAGDNLRLRPNGWRICIACARRRTRDSQNQRRAAARAAA